MPREPDSRMDREREHALVARSRSDASAFAELYDYYLPRIYGFVLRRVGDRTVAEDLTAMTFERGLAAIRRSDFRNDSFGGWLYRVASNAIVDHVRRGRRTVPLGIRAGDAADDDTGGSFALAVTGDDAAAAALAAAIDRDALARAMVDLPEHHRRLLVLKFYDNLEPDELCAAIGCSRSTLAVKLHRALRALRAAVTRESSGAA